MNAAITISTKESAWKQRWSIAGGWVFVAICVIIFWELASVWVFVIPSPGSTLHAFIKIGAGGTLGVSAWATAEHCAIGFLAAVAFGTVIGALLGSSDYWYEALSPLVVVSAAIPKLIIYPLLLLLLGISGASVTAMGFIGGIFPVLINVMVGIRNVRPVYVKVGRALRISPWQNLRHIYLPAVTLPLLAGIRLTFGLTLVNVIVAELFAAKVGVGKLIMTFYNLGQYADMMALMVSFFVVAMGGSALLWMLEQRLRRVQGA